MSDRFLAELAELSEVAAALDVKSRAEDFDTGLTTDDMLAPGGDPADGGATS